MTGQQQIKAAQLAAGLVRVGTQFDKVDTTLANITGLSVSVLSGRVYKIRAVIYTTSNVASGIKEAIGGGCSVSNLAAYATVYDAGAFQTPGTAKVTALATAFGDITAVTAAMVVIEGAAAVSASGTLTVQFADNAGTNTSSVLVGSYLEVVDIT